MARRRSKRSDSPTRIAARVEPELVFSPVVRHRGQLQDIEDRRRFHPERGFSPALSFSRRDQRRIVQKTRHVSRETGNPFLSPRVGFVVPERVAICVRRKQRREVIHAKGLAAGRGGGARRRNWFSDVDCR